MVFEPPPSQTVTSLGVILGVGILLPVTICDPPPYQRGGYEPIDVRRTSPSPLRFEGLRGASHVRALLALDGRSIFCNRIFAELGKFLRSKSFGAECMKMLRPHKIIARIPQGGRNRSPGATWRCARRICPHRGLPRLRRRSCRDKFRLDRVNPRSLPGA